MDPSRPLSFVALVLIGPALFTGLALLCVRRSPEMVRSVGALAIGIGYLLGHWASIGRTPSFPPTESHGALFFVALAATLAGWLHGSSRVPRSAGWLALAVVAAGAPWLILRNLMKQWTVLEALGTVACVAVAILALVFVLDGWAEKHRGPRVPLVGWLVATVISIAVVLMGSAIYAQFAATLAAVLGAAIVFGWIARDANYAGGLTAVFAVVIASTCVASVYLSEMPRTSALLFFYAPMAAVAVDRGKLAKLPGLAATAVQLAAVALVLAIALLISLDA